MYKTAQQAARDRVVELAADPRYRPFVIGYLLSCLDERHWEAMVAAAVEFGNDQAARLEDNRRAAAELSRERG